MLYSEDCRAHEFRKLRRCSSSWMWNWQVSAWEMNFEKLLFFVFNSSINLRQNSWGATTCNEWNRSEVIVSTRFWRFASVTYQKVHWTRHEIWSRRCVLASRKPRPPRRRRRQRTKKIDAWKMKRIIRIKLLSDCCWSCSRVDDNSIKIQLFAGFSAKKSDSSDSAINRCKHRLLAHNKRFWRFVFSRRSIT